MAASRHRTAALLATALLAVASASGCSGDGEPSGTGGASEVPVIVPGEPGEPARTVDADEVAGPEDAWNGRDVAFVQMMVPHHGQALEMSALARTRAGDARVTALAERIRAAQRPEILMMAAWLESRDEEVPAAGNHDGDHGHHGDGHGASMPGMLTPAQMAALRAARGPAFDRLFLTGMIRHHEGALSMATDVKRTGQDVRVAELATDVDVSQRAEIARMRSLLSTI